jgi:SAM-dependent methyltransferase
MLRMARTTADDHVVDLGAGDGRIVVTAARDFGARATGIEYNPELAAFARSRVVEAGIAGRAQILQGDLFGFDFSKATVVTMFLLPELNLRLRDRLLAMRPGTRVVSHEFDMGDWMPDERARVGGVDLFLWIVPARVSGQWEFRFFDGLPEETRRVRLEQKFQYAQGDLEEIRLDGRNISFSLRGAGGTRAQCKGRVLGDRMLGRCQNSAAIDRNGRWTAVRR